jgi:hypothetical protein
MNNARVNPGVVLFLVSSSSDAACLHLVIRRTLDDFAGAKVAIQYSGSLSILDYKSLAVPLVVDSA